MMNLTENPFEPMKKENSQGAQKKTDNINLWHSQNVGIHGEMYFF